MSWRIDFRYADGVEDWIELNFEKLQDAEALFDSTCINLERIGSSQMENTLGEASYNPERLAEVEETKIAKGG